MHRLKDDSEVVLTEVEDCADAFDRRVQPRHPIRLGVRFRSADELARAVRVFTKNIGLGGLCLLTRKGYQVGARLKLDIELGPHQSMSLSAVVAWVRPGKAIGVRFEHLSEIQRQQLESLLGK